MTPPIVLATLNAKYIHCSFGLRYLYANLREFQPLAKILEFNCSQNPRSIAELVLEANPTVVGFGVYIWNTRETLEVISILKRIQPNLLILLGGPEVSHEAEDQEICQLADFVIQGEADFQFFRFCKDFFGQNRLPEKKIILSSQPDLSHLELPYSFYTNEDILHRVIYVEASRGCPYRCEYCLSSLDKSVRKFPLDSFFSALDSLIQRGAHQFKFVDRTFNLNITTSRQILKFFLDRIDKGVFLHFELVPDRLPGELRELICQFPPGALQFEIGIQTWNPEVSKRVGRPQNYERIRENLSFLVRETSVHLHTDLIAGLPGESSVTFARGFDELAALNPQEIQVGVLKRLKGTPIMRHDQEWNMTYSALPPFEVLQTKTMKFKELQQIHRFSHFWNLIANSGNFKATLNYIKTILVPQENGSLFEFFLKLTDFIHTRYPQGNGIALINLVETVWIYLTQNCGIDRDMIRHLLVQDYTGHTKRDIPAFLRDSLSLNRSQKVRGKSIAPVTPFRQQRHNDF